MKIKFFSDLSLTRLEKAVNDFIESIEVIKVEAWDDAEGFTTVMVAYTESDEK